MDDVAQRNRQTTFRGFDAARPNMFQALRVVTKPDAPLGFDGAGGSIVEPVYNRLPLTLGNLDECRLGRRSRSRIPVPIERHVGDASVRSDGWWLPFCELEVRYIDGCLRHRRIVIRDVFLQMVHCVAARLKQTYRGTEGL